MACTALQFMPARMIPSILHTKSESCGFASLGIGAEGCCRASPGDRQGLDSPQVSRWPDILLQHRDQRVFLAEASQLCRGHLYGEGQGRELPICSRLE
eukprot:scaffold25378_cov34-Prasinocladus_malaysianus.AAC.1